jgi:hypothetical protein
LAQVGVLERLGNRSSSTMIHVGVLEMLGNHDLHRFIVMQLVDGKFITFSNHANSTVTRACRDWLNVIEIRVE